MNQAYLIGGIRTPIGKTGGFLKDVLPEQLASLVLNEMLAKYKLSPGDIGQVILGNAVGPGGNIARVSVLEAGWPVNIPAITVDSQCGSGLSAIHLAVSQIMAGQEDIILAGGVESTSLAPRRQFNPHDPRFQGDHVFYERAPFSPPAVGDPDVGVAAEWLAGQMDISRQEMDLFACESHKRAFQIQEQGYLKDIMIPVKMRGDMIIADECIRGRMNLKLLERMPAAFVAGGRITAGNTCLKHDGAAVVLVASRSAVHHYQLKPQAVIKGTASCGCDPNTFPLAPVYSIRKLLKNTSLTLSAIDAMEINEAFAVKILACCRQLGFSPDKTNILGGALAYGHPYGASGAIILLHLLKALQKVEGRFGIAAIGAVGGMGVSTLIERC